MKTSTILTGAAALVLTLLTGCVPATGNGSDSDGPVSTTVYDLAFDYSIAGDTATKHPGLTLQIKPAGTTEISQAVVTYAVNAAAFNGGLDGSSWIFNDAAWTNKAWSTGTNDILVADTWVTATLTSDQIATAYATTTSNNAGTSTSVTSVGGDVELDLWSTWSNWTDITGGHVYIQSIVLTYSDSTVETLTPDATLVGTGANAWRISNWTPWASNDGMTVQPAAISTVAF